MTPQIYYAMLRTFSTIVKMLNMQWKKYTLRDGRRGYILFFSEDVWDVDEETDIIYPRIDIDPAE